MKTKICSRCQKEKLLQDFNRDTTHIDGFQSACKKCRLIWRKKHKKELKLKAKIYYDTHQEKIKNTYYSPSGIYTALKSRARNRKIKFNLIKEDFISWYNKQEQKCHYCNRILEEINRNKFGRSNKLTIDRKNNNEGYEINNMVLCCMRCNYIKSDYFTEKEMIQIGQIIKNKVTK
jgi:hypothetical protein